MRKITRRSALVGAGAAFLSSTIARAQENQVVIGTWGGDYGDTLRETVDIPIMKPRGIDVLQDLGGPNPRRTKLIAERGARRSSMDVACLPDFDLYGVAETGALEPPTAENMPLISQIREDMRRPDFIVHMYSANIIVYNTDKVPVPPKSFADLWDPKWKGRVGLSDLLAPQNMVIAAAVGGGSQTNWEPAKAKLQELRSLDVKIMPSNEAVAAALKSEEIWFTIQTVARAAMWRRAGLPVAYAMPEEGGFPILFGACVPKSSRNKKNAFSYLNAMLEPSVQLLFARRMGYLPAVMNAKLPEDLYREISIPEADVARMMKPDYAYLAQKRTEMLDFWNKSFKS